MGVKKNADTREPVKLNCEVVGKVRENKKNTGFPIGKFFEKAAIEKLEREYVKSKK